MDAGLLHLQFFEVCIDISELKPSLGLKTGCPGSLERREHVVVVVVVLSAVARFVPRIPSYPGSPSLLGRSRSGAGTADLGWNPRSMFAIVEFRGSCDPRYWLGTGETDGIVDNVLARSLSTVSISMGYLESLVCENASKI